MHFSGNRTLMVVVVALRRGNKGIFCRICRVGQLSWKIAATLGATITNMKVVTFMMKILALISLIEGILLMMFWTISQKSSIIVQIGRSEAQSQYVNLKAFLIFSQLCENTHGRPTIFWLPGMNWVLVNIVPNLRGEEGQQRKYSHLAVTKPTVCSQTHKTDSQESSNHGTIVIRTLGGLSPKYWIIPENCQKIYFSKHLEVGGGPAQKLETHLSGD